MLLTTIISIALRIPNYTPFLIEGNSMTPTIKNNQFVILKNHFPTSTYQRGEIIVFSHANQQTSNPYYYIKRIIGLPNEKIKINSLGVFIKPSDQEEYFKLNENYLTKEHSTFYGLEKNYTVPENSYFVLGDNRNNSQDSRSFTNPYINQNEIYGKLTQ